MWRYSSLRDSMHDPAMRPPSPEALLEVAAASREEPGCISLQDFQSLRDPQSLPRCIRAGRTRQRLRRTMRSRRHGVRFLERVEPLIHYQLHVARTRRIG